MDLMVLNNEGKTRSDKPTVAHGEYQNRGELEKKKLAPVGSIGVIGFGNSLLLLKETDRKHKTQTITYNYITPSIFLIFALEKVPPFWNNWSSWSLMKSNFGP
jgi:hypothetical protein